MEQRATCQQRPGPENSQWSPERCEEDGPRQDRPSLSTEALEPRNLLSAARADVASAPVGEDLMHGSQGLDQPDVGDGDGRLFGGRGQNVPDGGDGDDQLSGGRGNDTVALSDHADGRIQDDGSGVTVDREAGGSFPIDAAEVENTVTDGSASLWSEAPEWRDTVDPPDTIPAGADQLSFTLRDESGVSEISGLEDSRPTHPEDLAGATREYPGKIEPSNGSTTDSVDDSDDHTMTAASVRGDGPDAWQWDGSEEPEVLQPRAETSSRVEFSENRERGRISEPEAPDSPDAGEEQGTAGDTRLSTDESDGSPTAARAEVQAGAMGFNSFFGESQSRGPTVRHDADVTEKDVDSGVLAGWDLPSGEDRVGPHWAPDAASADVAFPDTPEPVGFFARLWAAFRGAVLTSCRREEGAESDRGDRSKSRR